MIYNSYKATDFLKLPTPVFRIYHISTIGNSLVADLPNLKDAKLLAESYYSKWEAVNYAQTGQYPSIFNLIGNILRKTIS